MESIYSLFVGENNSKIKAMDQTDIKKRHAITVSGNS